MQQRQETRVQSLGGEHPLEKEMATHASILAWRMLWTEESGYSPWGCQESDMTERLTHTHTGDLCGIPHLSFKVRWWILKYDSLKLQFISRSHFGSLNSKSRASLVAQRRIYLPMHRTGVQSLVWEESICLGAAKPTCHNYWSRCA